MRIATTITSVILMLIVVAGLFATVQIFKYSSQSGSAIHEIEALICALITTVALAGVTVVSALEDARRPH